jgi:hypothetical protein
MWNVKIQFEAGATVVVSCLGARGGAVIEALRYKP